MSIIADPLARARATKTRLQAKRLYSDLDTELGLNDQLPDGYETQAEQALEHLRISFPGVQDDNPEADGYVPKLSGRAVQNAHSPDPKPEPAEDHERPSEPASPRAQRAQRARTIVRRGRGGSSRGRGGGSLLGGLGRVPVAGQATTSQMAMLILGGTVGLSLLYLLLANPQAVELGAGGAGRLFRGFVSPHVDPLNPSGVAPLPPASKAIQDLTRAGASQAQIAAAARKAGDPFAGLTVTGGAADIAPSRFQHHGRPGPALPVRKAATHH